MYKVLRVHVNIATCTAGMFLMDGLRPRLTLTYSLSIVWCQCASWSYMCQIRRWWEELRVTERHSRGPIHCTTVPRSCWYAVVITAGMWRKWGGGTRNSTTTGMWWMGRGTSGMCGVRPGLWPCTPPNRYSSTSWEWLKVGLTLGLDISNIINFCLLIRAIESQCA